MACHGGSNLGGACLGANEAMDREEIAQRLEVLRQLEAVGAPAERQLDSVARLVASHYRCPISLLTLVDNERSWVKAAFGSDAEWFRRTEAFCAEVVDSGAVVLSPDLSQDDRFRDSPLVSGEKMSLRFYAGAPIRVDETVVGALSVTDFEPKAVAAEETAFLEEAARLASCLLAFHRLKGERDRLQQTVELFSEGPSVDVEGGFFAWCVGQLAERVGLDVAFVAEITGASREEVRTRAVVLDGRPVEGFRYRLPGSPCARVVEEGIFVQERGAQQSLPALPVLAGERFEGYAGLALRDKQGRAIGFLSGLTRRPIADREHVVSMLRLFATRAASELDRCQAESALRLAIDNTAGVVGVDLLRSVTSLLRQAFSVRCVLVAERSGEQVRTLVTACDDPTVEGAHWSLHESPLAEVYRDGTWNCRLGAPITGCSDGDWIEGFLGLRLDDMNGEAVGHLALLHDGPLDERLAESPLLRLLGVRAAAELHRRRQDSARLDSERTRAELDRIESLGNLAGGVAHDFNNLLVVILGNVGLALSEIRTPSPLRNSLLEVQGSARRAAMLAKQMLAYSGKGSFRLEPCDLSVALRGIDPLLVATLPKNVSFEIHHDPGTPFAMCDATQVRQIITNLVLHAAGLMPEEGGFIRVGTGRRQIGSDELGRAVIDSNRPPGRYVFLEVSDNGPGIAGDSVRRIFDPYHEAAAEGASGLGLSAVHGIVRAHRAILLVSSTVGLGTTYEVLFPEAVETKKLREEAASPYSVWESCRRMLLVDDDPDVRRAIVRMLRSVGVAVTEAAGGREAIDLLAASPKGFDCVLLDVRMPDLDGVSTLRKLREIEPSCRVVLTSGYPENFAETEDFARADAFLAKPFQLADLQQKLAQIGKGSRTRQ